MMCLSFLSATITIYKKSIFFTAPEICFSLYFLILNYLLVLALLYNLLIKTPTERLNFYGYKATVLSIKALKNS